MPIRRSKKKRNAEPRQKQNHRRLVIDPMVNPGSSAHRHQARSKADPTRPHHRMVTLAQSSPGDRSARAPQSKTATVMLGVAGAYFCYPIRPGIIQATALFAQAAKEAGVKCVVNMSQISAREDAKSHAAQDHWLAERVFYWSGLTLVHLRPTYFAEGLLHLAPLLRARV